MKRVAFFLLLSTTAHGALNCSATLRTGLSTVTYDVKVMIPSITLLSRRFCSETAAGYRCSSQDDAFTMLSPSAGEWELTNYDPEATTKHLGLKVVTTAMNRIVCERLGIGAPCSVSKLTFLKLDGSELFSCNTEVHGGSL